MSSKTSTPRVPTIRAATAGLMGVAIGVMACSGAQGTGSTTQGGSDGYSGPIRLTNRSSASICGAEFYTREQRPFTIVDLSATPIAPGAEHTMEVGHLPSVEAFADHALHVFEKACDGALAWVQR